MATLDSSPSLFVGKSWSEWAENTPLSPLEEGGSDETSEKDTDDTDSMRLPFEDMHMYGHCPSQDEFYLILCEKCQKVVKPQAFKQHLFERHGVIDTSISSNLNTSHPLSKLSSPSKLTSPTRTHFKLGHSVPTKASVKEVPQSVTNAQKMGAALNARLKGFDKNKMNHSMPVVKVKRMEVKKVSQHYEPVSKPATVHSPPSKLTNGNSTKEDTVEPLDVKPIINKSNNALSTTGDTVPVSSMSGSLSLSQTIPSISVNCCTVTTATTTLTIASTACVTTTKSVIAPSVFATVQSNSTNIITNNKGFIGTFSKLVSSSNKNGVGSFNSVSPGILPSNKKMFKIEKPEKLIPCKDREYDCNKHCGVIVEETGKACTRSLTCKTHALSLRRKVPGRRKPFDDLLKEHRAAKELLLQQKAEQKAAQLAAAEIKAQQSKPVIPLGSSQLAQHLLRSGPPPSSNDHNTDVHSRLSQSGHLSPKKISKPSKPNNINQHRSSLTNLHSPLSAPYIKEEVKEEHFSDGEGEEEEEKSDGSFLSYQPKPAAMCTFGARSHMFGGRRSFMFGRKEDILRVAFLNVLEKQLNPPPPKKLCVESNLPKEPQLLGNSKDPYDFATTEAYSLYQSNPVLNSSNKLVTKSKSKSSSLNKSKSKDSSAVGHTTSHLNSAFPMNTTCAPPSNLKRKRSGGTLPNSSPSTYSTTANFNNVISSINSHPPTSLTAIAIPSVNLSSANIGQFSANQNHTGNKSAKNNMYKDLGIVVTGLDPSLVNGQYMITNPHQNQALDDKSLQQTHVINNKSNAKILNLETIQNLQKNQQNLITMPPLFVDGPLQAGTAVLTPVSIATTLGNQIVSVASSSLQTSQSLSNSCRTSSVSPQVSTTLHNGLVHPSTDKMINHRHNVLHNKKPVHSQASHGILGNTMIASSTSPQVCANQIFTTQLIKPGNLLIGKPSNKFAMPPGSLTLNVANLGVAGQQPTLFIASNEDIPQQQVSSSPSHIS